MDPPDALRASIAELVGFAVPQQVGAPVVHDEIRDDGFTRKTVSYAVRGETIDAFLFEPVAARRGAVVALHQYNSWNLGKSEIAGIAGDRHQAFGPVLALAGITVLAPDAIGFESRRVQATDGRFGYMNSALHGLERGELLITSVLADVAAAVRILRELAGPRVGVMGHSYGGNIALFAAALDERIAYACSSGAACSYRHKLSHSAGLEMALAIPGFAARFDIDDLMRCIAPRGLLVVSADRDPYTADATELVERARPAFSAAGAEQNLQHIRVSGDHPLDTARFAAIVGWIVAQGA